jgi:hypothetical protein
MSRLETAQPGHRRSTHKQSNLESGREKRWGELRDAKSGLDGLSHHPSSSTRINDRIFFSTTIDGRRSGPRKPFAAPRRLPHRRPFNSDARHSQADQVFFFLSCHAARAAVSTPGPGSGTMGSRAPIRRLLAGVGSGKPKRGGGGGSSADRVFRIVADPGEWRPRRRRHDAGRDRGGEGSLDTYATRLVLTNLTGGQQGAQMAIYGSSAQRGRCGRKE